MININTTPLWRITAYTHEFTTPAHGIFTHLTQNRPGFGLFGSAPDKAAEHSKTHTAGGRMHNVRPCTSHNGAGGALASVKSHVTPDPYHQLFSVCIEEWQLD